LLASWAGTPSSVSSAIASPTCFNDTPNVVAADKTPVDMAATKSCIRMLPAPVMVLTVAAAAVKFWAPLMPDRHAAAIALVVSSRVRPADSGQVRRGFERHHRLDVVQADGLQVVQRFGQLNRPLLRAGGELEDCRGHRLTSQPPVGLFRPGSQPVLSAGGPDCSGCDDCQAGSLF
jgi:hypothetical protein